MTNQIWVDAQLLNNPHQGATSDPRALNQINLAAGWTKKIIAQ